MGRRKFDRTVVKKCPICGQQIPVACRYCSCGHQFTARVRNSSSTSSLPDDRDNEHNINEDSNESKRRRTDRTKRVRPDFFNSLDLEYTTRHVKPQKQKELESPKKKRGRPKGSVNKPKEPEPTTPTPTTPTEAPSKPFEEDVFAEVPQDKLNKYNIILSEINRKVMCTQTFNPV